MRKPFILICAAGLAASALAMAVPLTAHAAGTKGGVCSNGLQHTGPGDHSFTDSHKNCVQFSDSSQTAFLNGSDFNSIFFDVNSPGNAVKHFFNSNNNAIAFNSGTSGNLLTSNGSNGNSVTFCGPSAPNTGICQGNPGAAVNDFVLLDHLTGETIFIANGGAPNAIRIVDDPNDNEAVPCLLPVSFIPTGTPDNPTVVVC